MPSEELVNNVVVVGDPEEELLGMASVSVAAAVWVGWTLSVELFKQLTAAISHCSLPLVSCACAQAESLSSCPLHSGMYDSLCTPLALWILVPKEAECGIIINDYSINN